jgi:phage terminase large subunit
MPIISAVPVLGSGAGPAPLTNGLSQSIIRRYQLLVQIGRDPVKQGIELEVCRRDIRHWFDYWVWTYDPRLASQGGDKGLPHLPLDLYKRQLEMVEWLEERIALAEDGLLEKSRDIGFTWTAGGLALHKWRFVDGFKTTFGSRKELYVDKIADPDSIFEKIRMIYRALPKWMWPRGFDPAKHDNYLQIYNPENGNLIRGESGDSMGRGGRSSLYIIDEAAYIDRADRVEAATSANSEVRIWGSSVNGNGNLFYRKRFGGSLQPRQIFRYHYSDDPRKTPEWAAKKKASLEPHVWASEYELDYSASTEGICIPAKWVDAAKVISKYVDIQPATRGLAGGDVGAGKAKSVVVARFGPVVRMPQSWGDPDTIETANRMLEYALAQKFQRADGWQCSCAELLYDNVGVGRGTGDALNRQNRLPCKGVNVGQPPSKRMWPDGATSLTKFVNLKAEAWWLCREAFKRTHEMLLFCQGAAGGQEHEASTLISIPADNEGPEAMVLAGQLSLVTWQRDEKGKIQIESKQHLAQRGIASPDYADSLVLTYAAVSHLEMWEAMAGVEHRLNGF